MFKFGKSADNKVKSLIKLLPSGGRVLDLGAGWGGNSIFLAKHGFKVTCLDKNKEAITAIKRRHPSINGICSDILDFNFPRGRYDLVLIINVLHFFNLKEIKLIINKIIKSLKKRGLLYLQVFSTQDPGYRRFLKKHPGLKKKNTFRCGKGRNFIHFFTKEELISLFSKNNIIEIEKLMLTDNHLPLRKYRHGIIRMLIRK